MNEIRLFANAKLNLALDIVGRRADGYHLLDMVNRSVDLSDEITISRGRNAGITIKSNARFLPKDERNHAYKAVTALAAFAGIPVPDVDLYIKKRIPTQAGLGGGSADAAAVLIGLNALFELHLSGESLAEIGLRVGADVPFCLVGGAARVGGIGEEICPIPDNCDYTLVIVMPQGGHSTREAFAAIDRKSDGYQRPELDALIASLAAGDTSGMAMHLCNVFQTVERNEQIEQLADVLLRHGALGAAMTGSGSAVFGVFKNSLDANKCCRAIRSKNTRVFTARPAAEGVHVLTSK